MIVAAMRKDYETWINYFRKSIEHPLFRRPLVWHYWDYCLMSARHESKTIDSGGKPLIIERGCFITGRRQAASQTGLTEQNVRTAQKILINHEMIEIITSKSTSKFTYIRVCNYGSYQLKKNESNQQSNQQLTTPKEREERTKKGKKVKENTANNKKLSEFFEKIWEIYPARNGRKLSKKESKEWFIKNIALEVAPKVLIAAQNYASSGEMPRDCIRFLAGKKSDKDWDWKDWEKNNVETTETDRRSDTKKTKWGTQPKLELPHGL